MRLIIFACLSLVVACAAPRPVVAQSSPGAVFADRAGERSERWIIHAGRLIDAVGDAPRERVTVFVRDGKIEKITAGYAKAAKGVPVIDLRRYTVMPGLMRSRPA